MALMQNFNRIVRLKIYTASGDVTVIDCPTKGRKPKIEINGTFSNQSYLPSFNITITNLYLNLRDNAYSTVEVEAGYEGRTTTFTGKIYSLYQEAPGPEGRTVIQCKEGNIEPWLDATVQISAESGTPLLTVLNTIAKTLGVYRVVPGASVNTMTLKQRIEHDGSARGAIEKLKNMFEDKRLDVFIRGNFLCAILLQEGQDFINSYVLEYMSAPPQENVGGSNGTYYTTITAPWMPELRIGDRLTIPSRTYIRSLVKVGNVTGKQDIKVSKLSFHFATTGSINQMTVQGYLVGK